MRTIRYGVWPSDRLENRYHPWADMLSVAQRSNGAFLSKQCDEIIAMMTQVVQLEIRDGERSAQGKVGRA